MIAPDFDPLVPRSADLPTPVPLDAEAPLAPLDTAKIIAAPDDPADWRAWRAQLQRWRASALQRAEHDSSLYERADLGWTRRCVLTAQVWIWDELLYDWDHDTFTPERLLDDLRDRFGEVDALVLWHAYPVIGIDARNQWDYYRLVPGLPALIGQLQSSGVRVFCDYNPWDTGTRRGSPDLAELAELVALLKVDGVFLDTMPAAGEATLRTLSAARAGVAVEGESTLPTQRLRDHPLSWAQWFADSPVPGVVRARYLERGHQLHHIRRWNRDHHAELQSAWFNGIGVMIWEVVFGIWVGWNRRDAAMARLLGRTHRHLAPLLENGVWTPLVDLGPGAAEAGVYGSLFSTNHQAYLALVNRSAQDQHVSIPNFAASQSIPHPYDVRTTSQLLPDTDGRFTITVPGVGIAGLWWPAPRSDTGWLYTPLDTPTDTSFPYREPARTLPAPSRAQPDRDNHVIVPAGRHQLTARYRCRETGIYGAAPFVDEWKPLPPRLHDQRTTERVTTLDHPVAVASREVTRAQFRKFVTTTGYRGARTGPEQPWWRREPTGGEDIAPATQVDLDDARAYARWAGARIPTEDEWQLAATIPGFHRMTPHVWNHTESEHTDGRTRFEILKGGADFRADGSPWYFDGGPKPPDFSATYVMPGSGLGRSTSIGFRCAWDLLNDLPEKETHA